MPNLNEIFTDAQGGHAMAMLGRAFGLAPEQTQAAVTALLPAISSGLKRATATPEGLTNLLAVAAQQRDLRGMYDDPSAAVGARGRAAGNDVLSVIFGSPDVSRAVAEQAQLESGVGASTLKDLLPVLAGMLVSGMFGSKSAEAQAAAQQGGGGGGLWDILEQIFQRGIAGQAGGSTAPSSPLPVPGGQPLPVPGGGGQVAPGGDLLSMMLREMLKAIQDGRLKPVVVQIPFPGGGQIPLPGGQTWQLPSDTGGQGGTTSPAPSSPAGATPSDEILPGPKMPTGGQSPSPGGDLGAIFGNILRDLLGGGGRMPQAGIGSALFGDRFEPGRDVDRSQVEEIEGLLDKSFGRRSA